MKYKTFGRFVSIGDMLVTTCSGPAFARSAGGLPSGAPNDAGNPKVVSARVKPNPVQTGREGLLSGFATGLALGPTPS